MRKILTTAVAGAALVLGVVTPSWAADSELEVDVEVDECIATITFTNNWQSPFWGDYRLADDQGFADTSVDGPNFTTDTDLPPEDEWGHKHNHGVAPEQELTAGKHAGEKFGLQYNPVIVHPGESETVTVKADAPTTVEARIWRGPVQEFYVPWTDPQDLSGCVEAEAPSVEQYVCALDDGYAADLVIPGQENVSYEVGGVPAEAGAHAVEPGEYAVTAHAAEGYVLEGDSAWDLKVTPVNGCVGDQGPKGEPGKDGADGAAGADGKDGETITIKVPTRVNTGR